MTKRLRQRATAVVVRNDRVLLVLLVSDAAGIFMLPGGGVEPGERPEAAVVRELCEETGLIATRTEYQLSWDSAVNRHLVYPVEAEGDVEVGSEIGDYRWWDRRECLPIFRHVEAVPKAQN
jgi:8-oxo-dGTP pyrophosphatase MutT (NUDIX family)